MEGIGDLLHSKSGYLARHLACQSQELVDQQPAKRATVVLDIDETLLSASPWTLEISVGDSVVKKSSPKEFVVITALLAELALPDQQTTLVLQSQREINQLYTSDFADSCDVIGVQVQSAQGQCVMSLESLQKEYEPRFKRFSDLVDYNSRRPNVTPVSFICDGLVVRLRPFLPTFLSYVREKFNVILFTAAPRAIYAKLLRYVEKSLSPILGDDKLWGSVFFREDCDFSSEHQAFRKNIGKLGIDLSRILIVDDNPFSFAGYEPNAIWIGPFHGSQYDDQLVRVMQLLKLAENSADVRYPLCNLTESCNRSESCWTNDSMPTIDERCEWGQSDEGFYPSSLGRTIQFLADLQSTYPEA